MLWTAFLAFWCCKFYCEIFHSSFYDLVKDAYNSSLEYCAENVSSLEQLNWGRTSVMYGVCVLSDKNCTVKPNVCSLTLKGDNQCHFQIPKFEGFFRIFMKCLLHTLYKIPRWSFIITRFLPYLQQLCSQRPVYVHVSLNDNHLLLTLVIGCLWAFTAEHWRGWMPCSLYCSVPA